MVSTTIAKSFSYSHFHRVNISQAASRSSDATTQRARKGKNQTQVERAEVSRHDGKRCHSNVQRRGKGVGNSAGGALSTNVLGTRRGGTPACFFWTIFSHCHQHLWQERHGGGSRAQQGRNPFAMEHTCGQNDRGAVSHLWLLLTQWSCVDSNRGALRFGVLTSRARERTQIH